MDQYNSHGPNKGTCSVSFYFAVSKRSKAAKESAEFVFEISVKHSNQVTEDARREIERRLNEAVEQRIHEEFSRVVGERKGNQLDYSAAM